MVEMANVRRRFTPSDRTRRRVRQATVVVRNTARRGAVRFKGVFDAVTKKLSNLSNNPTVMALAMVALVMIIMEYMGPSTSLLRKLINDTTTVKLSDDLKLLLSKHYKRIFGLFIYLPFLYGLRTQIFMITTFVSGLWIFFSPPATIFQYALQAISIYLFMGTRQVQIKAAVISILIFFHLTSIFPVFNAGTKSTLSECLITKGFLSGNDICFYGENSGASLAKDSIHYLCDGGMYKNNCLCGLQEATAEKLTSAWTLTDKACGLSK